MRILKAGVIVVAAFILAACGSAQKEVQSERVFDYSSISFGETVLFAGTVVGKEYIPVVMVDQVAIPITHGPVSFSSKEQDIRPRVMSFEDVERYNREVRRLEMMAITSGRFIRGGAPREIQFVEGIRYTLQDGLETHDLVVKTGLDVMYSVGDLIEVFQADAGDIAVQKIVRKPIGLGEGVFYRYARKATTKEGGAS